MSRGGARYILRYFGGFYDVFDRESAARVVPITNYKRAAEEACHLEMMNGTLSEGGWSQWPGAVPGPDGKIELAEEPPKVWVPWRL